MKPSKATIYRIFLISISIAIIILASILFNTATSKSHVVQKSSVSTPQVQPSVSTSTKVTSENAVTKQLQQLATDQTPTAAFQKLKSLLIQNPRLINQCHDLTHRIGDAAFEKYGGFQQAMKFSNDMCGSGYIHSLIVDALKETSDPTSVIKTICDGQDGYCYHGIGHGLMFFTENDVPRAVAFCTGLDTKEHAARCSEGVYMQNFEDDQDYPTPFVYANDPLKLCRDEPYYKPACYHYTGSYLAKEHKADANFFTQCDVADPAYIGKCVSGMGAYLLSAHLNDTSIAVHICETAPNQKTINACIDGLVSYDLVNFNSIPHTEALCASVSKEWQTTCTASLETRKNFYK